MAQGGIYRYLEDIDDIFRAMILGKAYEEGNIRPAVRWEDSRHARCSTLSHKQ
jgi:hypothetical protein